MLAAALAAAAVLWLAAASVQERLAFEGRRLVAHPRLRPGLLGLRAVALFLTTSFAFAMLESTIHWRAGLGWHGLHCLTGPVHRDAIPVLAALSLIAVAIHGAVEHLLLWARRLFAQLAARVWLSAGARPAPSPLAALRSSLSSPANRVRGPPAVAPSPVPCKPLREGVDVNALLAGRRRSPLVIACALVAALIAASAASAHARISPPVSVANKLQLYSLAVPTEKANATTTKIVLTVPAGFSIDSFVPSPGWQRVLQQTGSGDSAVIQKVTWTGGDVPTEEDSLFQFLGEPAKTGTYTFQVEQTYSDGSIVELGRPRDRRRIRPRRSRPRARSEVAASDCSRSWPS